MFLSRQIFPALASVVSLFSAGNSTAQQHYSYAGSSKELMSKPIMHDEVGEDAFEVPFSWLDQEELNHFMHGRNVFRASWVPGGPTLPPFSGLGPHYNRSACSSCHHRNGRGALPSHQAERLLSMVVRLDGGPRGASASQPHIDYGDVLQYQATGSVPAEGHLRVHYEAVQRTLPDGSTVTLRQPRYSLYELGYGALDGEVAISPRLAGAIVGPGLIQAVPDKALVAGADPDDADGDGISGRVSMVLDHDLGYMRPGRFGWKAEHPTIRQFIASALSEDLGVTSAIYPKPNCKPDDDGCLDAYAGPAPEASDSIIDALEAYLSGLAVPAPRIDSDPNSKAGYKIFRQIGCAHCHTEQLPSEAQPDLAGLSGQPVPLYSDLLLHDMGEGLADHRDGQLSRSSEWRTPPLWGIGLTGVVNGNAVFLHDGRARSLEEAILWHGGEADQARAAYEQLPVNQRRQLIAFLEAL